MDPSHTKEFVVNIASVIPSDTAFLFSLFFTDIIGCDLAVPFQKKKKKDQKLEKRKEKNLFALILGLEFVYLGKWQNE